MTLGMANDPEKRRKLMVVAEATRESAVALRYVLSHVVFDDDILYLLHVENPSFWMNRIGHAGCIGGNIDFLDQMKHVCEMVHPDLKVRLLKLQIDAKDKGNAIITQTKLHGIDLLVVGKRHSLSNAILRQKYGSIRETAEYLLENSKCRCVAVQGKGHSGGYLLHTKTHRNFWLLA